jgi:hypothetical protein
VLTRQAAKVDPVKIAAPSIATVSRSASLHASLSAGMVPGGSKSVTFTADNAGLTDLRVGTGAAAPGGSLRPVGGANHSQCSCD